jgi:hypothetical protein
MRQTSRRTSTPSMPGAPSGGKRSIDSLASTVPARRPGVIRVDPRPDTILIEVQEDDDLDEGLEHLRKELEALAFSSELI